MELSRLPCCPRLWSVIMLEVNYRNVVLELISIILGFTAVCAIAVFSPLSILFVSGSISKDGDTILIQKNAA